MNVTCSLTIKNEKIVRLRNKYRRLNSIEKASRTVVLVPKTKQKKISFLSKCGHHFPKNEKMMPKKNFNLKTGKI